MFGLTPIVASDMNAHIPSGQLSVKELALRTEEAMKHFRLFSAILILLCLLWCPNTFAPRTLALAAPAQSQKNEVRVWVNTHSGVYHCPGTRWYGNTKEGKYMSECEAQKAGYRPAYGKPCGSDCK